MNNEKLQINLPDGATELIIREGQAAKILDPKAPIKFNLDGTLGCVTEFLEKRVATGQFKQSDCHILVNREKLTIKLVFNERDEYNTGSVLGTLEHHPDFDSLAINEPATWEPMQLGLLFKMHRAWFRDNATRMSMVSTLMHFTADINTKVEREAKESGSKTDNFAQVVNSNLPAAFNMSVRIFKGYAPSDIEVETFAQVDGRTIKFALLSPGAQEILETLRDEAIDKELGLIREIAPDIAIIEQ